MNTQVKTPGGRPPRSPFARLVQGVLWTFLVLVAVAVGLVLWFAHDVTTPDDGDRYADDLVERTAFGIADDVEPSYAEPLDAETLAQRAVQDPRLADGGNADYDIRVLGWDGSSGDDDGARIDLWISAEVPSWSSGAIFGDSRTAGSSTSCWRFVVRAGQYDDVADHERIDCPADLAAATPHPTPLPSLAPDAEVAVLDALDGLPDEATADDAIGALRVILPEFVDVRAERSGDALVATVGVGRSRDCIVAVRSDGDVAWRFTDFDRILLEPGELGCDPALYLRPVTTH